MTDLVDLMQSHAHRQNYRRGDPQTSREAGVAARESSSSQYEAIYGAIRLAGRSVAAEEISDILHWNNYVRVNRRLKTLERAGRIERTEERYINRVSGCAALRYRVAGAA